MDYVPVKNTNNVAENMTIATEHREIQNPITQTK